MKQRTTPTLGALAQGALAVLLALCLAQPALAAGKNRHRITTKKKVQTLRRAQGLRASIDPATGRLGRPSVTDAPGAAPAPAAARVATDETARDIPVVRLANGTESATLDDRYLEYEVVRAGADGKLEHACVQGARAAEKVRQEKPQPAKELK